jgi:hypothetical protein
MANVTKRDDDSISGNNPASPQGRLKSSHIRGGIAAAAEPPGVHGVGGRVIAAQQRQDLAKVAAAGGAPPEFQDNGGAIIEIVRLQLIFWGSAWGSSPQPTPSADQIVRAVETILSGPYMIDLAQYRQIGRGYLLGSTIYTNSSPPNSFSDDDVWNFLSARINDGTLPALDAANQNLYLVVMPQGISSSGAFIGEHTYATDGAGNRVHFAWVTNGGTLASVTSVLSHELVESCTDPEGSAILGTAGTCSQGGWCEISDICYTDEVLDGITVQRYWSQTDRSCIVPSWPQTNFPISGVQWTGTVPANGVVTWFTYGWPEYYFMLWEVVPRSVLPGAPEVSWRVQVERASGAYITYWIQVTNLTNQDIEIEGRYSILGTQST